MKVYNLLALIMVVNVAISAETLPNETASIGYSYAYGKPYYTIIRQATLENSLAWNPYLGEDVPIKPHTAYVLTNNETNKFELQAGDKMVLAEIALREVRDSKWMYYVIYNITRKGVSMGVPEQLLYIVTMGGVVISLGLSNK